MMVISTGAAAGAVCLSVLVVLLLVSQIIAFLIDMGNIQIGKKKSNNTKLADNRSNITNEPINRR